MTTPFIGGGGPANYAGDSRGRVLPTDFLITTIDGVGRIGRLPGVLPGAPYRRPAGIYAGAEGVESQGPIAGPLAPIGVTLFPDGTAVAPSIAFASQPDLGLYRTTLGLAPGTGKVGVTGILQVEAGALGVTSGGLFVPPNGPFVGFAYFRGTLAAMAPAQVNDELGNFAWLATNNLSTLQNVGRIRMVVTAAGAGSPQTAMQFFTLPSIGGLETLQLILQPGGSLFWATDNAADIGAAAGNRPRTIYVGTSLVIATDPGGGGVLRIGGASFLNGIVTTGGAVLAAIDNANDIGATGATRFRRLFLGTSLNLEADRGVIFTNQTSSAAAAVGTLTNAPAAGNPTFWLRSSINGVNVAIPAWPG